MDENCKRQKEVERTYGGLLPAVEGHSLGTRYKVQAVLWPLEIFPTQRVSSFSRHPKHRMKKCGDSSSIKHHIYN